MTALTLYPAIDLKDGQCVRLQRGAMDQATVYSSDPAGQARAWQDAGFVWLHVVDLNGAFAGRPVNAAAVAAILSATTVPVQLGGGIRERKIKCEKIKIALNMIASMYSRRCESYRMYLKGDSFDQAVMIVCELK